MSEQSRQAERKLHEQAFPSEAIIRRLEDRIVELEGQIVIWKAKSSVQNEIQADLEARVEALVGALRTHGGFHAPEVCPDRDRPRRPKAKPGTTCFYCEPALSSPRSGWRCGKCDGGDFPCHSPRCPKRECPMPDYVGNPPQKTILADTPAKEE